MRTRFAAVALLVLVTGVCLMACSAQTPGADNPDTRGTNHYCRHLPTRPSPPHKRRFGLASAPTSS